MKQELDIDEQIKAEEAMIRKKKKLLELQQQHADLDKKLLAGTQPLVSVCRAISETVCKGFDISIGAMNSRCRTNQVAIPRMVSYFLVRKLTKYTFGEIGRAFSKDHSAILHGCRAIDSRIGVEPGFARQIAELETQCREKLKAIEEEPTP